MIERMCWLAVVIVAAQIGIRLDVDVTLECEREFSTVPGGSTAFYHALHMAVEKLKNGQHSRKAVLLITDGEDNSSRFGFREVREILKEQDVQVYAIGTFVNRNAPSRLLHRSPAEVLTEFADITGGEAFFPATLDELPDLCQKIADSLRTEYVLGYEPTNRSSDGKWRKIHVKVTPPRGIRRIVVHTKAGYYAPNR
jgi:Ca-activated chloride channel homolog